MGSETILALLSPTFSILRKSRRPRAQPDRGVESSYSSAATIRSAISAADADLALFACRPLVQPPIRAAHLDDVQLTEASAVRYDAFLARLDLQQMLAFQVAGSAGADSSMQDKD